MTIRTSGSSYIFPQQYEQSGAENGRCKCDCEVHLEGMGCCSPSTFNICTRIAFPGKYGKNFPTTLATFDHENSRSGEISITSLPLYGHLSTVKVGKAATLVSLFC